MEQLECACYALQEVRFVVFGGFIGWPRDVADFGHRGEPVIDLSGVPLGFPRVAPRPVDAYSAVPVMTSRNVALVVRTGRRHRVHRDPLPVGLAVERGQVSHRVDAWQEEVRAALEGGECRQAFENLADGA